jgi:hypothetical protein
MRFKVRLGLVVQGVLVAFQVALVITLILQNIL